MSLIKINILRHLVCDVTSSPFPRPPRGWGGNAGEGLKTAHVHDTATSGVGCYNDVISGREKRLQPTQIYDYDVTSGL